MRAHEIAGADEEVELEEVMSELEAGEAIEAEVEADATETLPHEVVRYEEALAAMGAILDGGEVELDRLGALGSNERDALAHLVTVVRGVEGSRQVLAEDRLAQLEDVLAVMQPVLSIAALPGAEALRDSFTELVDQLDELREELEQLEAAQEEAEAEDEEVEEAADAGEPDDASAAPAPDVVDEAAAAKAASRKLDSTLSAQRKGRKAAAARAARGEASVPVPEVGSPERISTLAGAPGEAAVERPPWTTTLTGGDEPGRS